MSSDEGSDGTVEGTKGIDFPKNARGKENWNYDAPVTKRLTFRAPAPLLEELEVLVEAGVFHNRSEAMRAGLRAVVFGDYDRRNREGSDAE